MSKSFEVGEYVVCPGHGVGQICDVEEKVVGGSNTSFYHVKIISNGMKIIVPTNSRSHIRRLIEKDEIGQVFQLLSDHDVFVDNSTWNRRNRDYTNKIKTGSILEIAEVLRALFLLKNRKNLSYGEKKMLDQCKELIAEEIALSNGREKIQINTEIEQCFKA